VFAICNTLPNESNRKMAPVEKEKRDVAVTIRMRASVKAMAEKLAKQEDSSFANYIERLIIADARSVRPPR
jgi:hypothetical protein